MTPWIEEGLVDDIRVQLFACRAQGRSAALATITAADGGPRPVGAQMLIVEDRFWGFLSGGCIEADVALNARRVIDDGAPLELVYGRGSPFVDMRLPCGGRIEVLVERVLPSDEAVAELERCWHQRSPARWRSDGRERRCGAVEEQTADAARDEHHRWIADLRFDPLWRLRVIGDDPFALAIAAMGRMTGFDTRLIAPFAPEAPPPFDLDIDRASLAAALAAEPPDGWTAIVLATHDIDLDEVALTQVLRTGAGYIGVLGARRRIAERTRRLIAAGCSAADLARVRMPLGLPIRARSAWEIAVAAIGEIIAARRSDAP